MKVQKINNEKVQPIPVENISPDKIKGYKLFPNIYSNIFLVARKKSGKTSVISKIVESCVGKNTNVYIFASTVDKDPSLLHIVNSLEKKNIPVFKYSSVKEGKIDNLELILEAIQQEAAEAEAKKKEDKNKNQQKELKRFIFDDDTKNENKKKRKPKKICPEHVFIFDDVGNELTLPSISQLLKTNRHNKSKVIISSQYLNDLAVAGRKNIDYWLLFKGQALDKLETIHKDADLPISFEQFVEMYDAATFEPYNFLYIDCRNDEYRINFNLKIV